jgi:hypothetical protein
LQPEIDELKAEANSVTNAQNLDQLRSTFDTIRSDVESVLSSVSSDLSCK